MFTFEEATYGFETAKEVLGIGSNTLNKIIDQHLVAIRDDGSSPRNQCYAGFDIGYLASARNRPLLIPEGEIALVCSMGVENQEQPPSMYLDATWGRLRRNMQEIEQNLNQETWEQVLEGNLRVVGYWRVTDQHVEKLINDKGIVVASYGGFILDGGRVIDVVPNVTNRSGGRCYVVEPFNEKDRFRFAHNFLAARQGPPNRIWTAQELAEEAEARD